MLATRFTELVGCAVPIQQAGLGTVSPPEQVAAVAGRAIQAITAEPTTAKDHLSRILRHRT